MTRMRETIELIHEGKYAAEVEVGDLRLPAFRLPSSFVKEEKSKG